MHNRIYIQDNSGKIIYESEIQINRCAMFATVDPKATEMPEFSPYTFCMGDPVNYVDADGMQPSVMEAALMAQYVYKDKETRDIALRALKDSKWVLSEFPTSIRMNYTGTFENGLQSVLFQRETNGKIEYAYVLREQILLRMSWKTFSKYWGWHINVIQLFTMPGLYQKSLGTESLPL